MSWHTSIGVEDRRAVQLQIKKAYLDSCPSYEELLQVVVAIDEEFVHAVSTSADEYYASASRFGTKVRNKRAEFVDRDTVQPPFAPVNPFGAGGGKGKKIVDEPLEIGEIFDLDAAFKKGSDTDKKKGMDEESDFSDELDLAEGLSKSVKEPSGDFDDFDFFGKSQKSEPSGEIEIAQALSASIQTAAYDAAKSKPARGRTDFASRRSNQSKGSLKQSYQRNAFNVWQQQKPAPVVPPRQYASQKKQRQAFSTWASAPAVTNVSSSFAQARAKSRLNRLKNTGKFQHKPTLATQFSL